MRIAVFGTGGVGGYFGGRLAQAGEEVTFIARGTHLKAIREEGLRVKSVKGDFMVNPAQATEEPEQVGPVDAVLVAVKAWQVSEAARLMEPMVGPDTFVVPLENGVEAPGHLAKELGKEHVLGGLCRILAYISAPGEIRHEGIEPYIAFGEVDGRRSERAERLRQAFAGAQGVSAEIPDDIERAMWRKFLLICTWSGVGAITRAPIGVVRTQPETRQMLQQSMQEVRAVARARGIHLQAEAAEETMAFLDGVPGDGTASMQRDVMEGRPSELDSQSGAVARLGQEAGVETPLHRFIYHSLLPLERRARGEVQFE